MGERQVDRGRIKARGGSKRKGGYTKGGVQTEGMGAQKKAGVNKTVGGGVKKREPTAVCTVYVEQVLARFQMISQLKMLRRT